MSTSNPRPFGNRGGGAPAQPGSSAVGGSSVLGRLIGSDQPSGKKDKVPAYLPVELLEQLRNTVVGLQRDADVEDPPVSLSAFVQAAVEAAVRQAEQQHNEGRPYPQRPHARLKTGPPVG